jgi:ankyrin repeat protein
LAVRRARAHPVRGKGGAHLVSFIQHNFITSISRPTPRTPGCERRDAMNVEQLRKQAKDLVKAARAGDADALQRLGGREPILARAQLVVAREQGYASWPALVAAAEANVESFLRAAVDGRRARAEMLLEARPEIAHDPWAALALGHGRWEGDVHTPGGPLGWAPLLYACHSCFATTDAALHLLARGADPNAYFVNEYGNMSALYGAAGVKHDPALTRALLEAGAQPDDGESLYHAAYADSPECVALLLEFGATVDGSNALAAAVDEDHVEHVRLMLEARGNPLTTGALVTHAVRRGCGVEMIRLLARFGADVNAPGGETWRGDVPLRTPYQHAVLRNRDEIAAVLAELGADTTVSDADRAIAAIARGEAAGATLDPAMLDVDAQEVLVLAALRGHLDEVVAAVGPDFRGVVGGSPVLPLIGHAAWVGSPVLVQRLLALGADPLGGGTSPLATAAHASQYHEVPGRDFVGVAELLVAAGNAVEPAMLDVADGPLAAWLEQRLTSRAD